MPAAPPYVPSRFGYRRRRSRAVMVGTVQVGGGAPLVLQSMCTTKTTDVAATVRQSCLLAEAGCQIVRITAPGVKDAQALKEIRAGFTAAGFRDMPLVADIHFMPAAAMEAIEHVEKVRVNPGNFADKKRFAAHEYTDQEYREELARVAERFLPLVRRAKQLGRALRIGTNHGSLSDRIMNRHGDTPAGMVESAMEFVVIAESEGYKDLIISMKSSNPKVMVEAYRLLVARLDRHGEPYPLHLGVTEAGDGEDGRVKSAAGIGALLEDGIGDTIRVSLTEPPECEIPVARQLAARYAPLPEIAPPAGAPAEAVDPYAYVRRVAGIARLGAGVPIGGGLVPRVLAPATAKPAPPKEPPPDAVVDDGHLWALQARSIPGAEGCQNKSASGVRRPASGEVPLVYLRAGDCAKDAAIAAGSLVLIRIGDGDPVAALRKTLAVIPESCVVGLAEPGIIGETRAYRLLAAVDEELFKASGIRHALAIALPFQRDELAIAAIAGGLLIDGIGDCLYLPQAPDPRRLAFTLLQAVKARVTRADYVACPSCGRTQFDLMEVTAHIKEATAHLDGVTIAIMGCIVNGPGEMADADFGYVGSGPGKIDLYRGREVVRKNLPPERARDELIALIKESGKWREPSAEPAASR
jgi:(E)-4-hydroxy-3-methylbut-2-enyl-diphosphate synthase